MVIKSISLALLLGLVAACTPELADRASLVESPRILALTAFPAEASPNEAVTLSGLLVGPEGTLSMDGLPWAFCVERRPLTELGPVSPSCLQTTGNGVLPIGEGPTVMGSIPADACRLFGPDRPEPKAGEPAGRPADPDPSGGYYQPFRLGLGQEFVTGSVRIACGLGGATPAQAATFQEQYRRNVAPEISSFVLRHASGVEESIVMQNGAIPKVAGGESVTLEVAWPACSKDASCGGAEAYLWFDPNTRVLRERREGIRISWFVTGGEVSVDRTGRSEDEADITNSANTWMAPNEAGDIWVWAVARDDRGGVGFQGGRVRVEER